MAGTRSNGIENEPTVLQAEFRHNGALYDPYSIDKVEIYPSAEDAENNTNMIEEIESGDITKVSLGLWEYTASEIINLGTYFDKVYYVPLEGYSQLYEILPFYIRKESFGVVGPGDIELCKVVFHLRDIFANASEEDELVIKMNREWAWYGKQQIRRIEHDDLEQDDDGKYEIYLVETSTMKADTGADVYYILKAGRFEYKFTVPKGTLEAYLKDLPQYN